MGHKGQHQLMRQAVLALAERVDLTSYRYYALPDVQGEPPHKGCMHLPTTGSQDLLDRLTRPEHHPMLDINHVYHQVFDLLVNTRTTNRYAWCRGGNLLLSKFAGAKPRWYQAWQRWRSLPESSFPASRPSRRVRGGVGAGACLCGSGRSKRLLKPAQHEEGPAGLLSGCASGASTSPSRSLPRVWDVE